MEWYFSTVTGLAILLKQDPSIGVFMKTFQNFEKTYVLCKSSRQLQLNLWTILIVSAPSFPPYLYVGTGGGGRSASSEFYVESSLG